MTTVFSNVPWMILVLGGCMSNGSQATNTDLVKSGTDQHTDRVFGHVAEWSATGGTAKITMSDQSAWTLSGEDRIKKYRALLDLSKSSQVPLLLAVNTKTRQVGMIFSTMTGKPELWGETADKKQLQVSIPPSMRIFRLQKDRPWFNEVRMAIDKANKPADPVVPQKYWISFDSPTNEVIDVRPASK